jgi:hypothetical protein
LENLEYAPAGASAVRGGGLEPAIRSLQQFGTRSSNLMPHMWLDDEDVRSHQCDVALLDARYRDAHTLL